MLKKRTKGTHICDNCGIKLKKDFFIVSSYPNEGCSTIEFDNQCYYFDSSDFCSLNCFVEHIKKILK